MKRLIAFVTALILIVSVSFATTTPAFSDVVFGNDFEHKHRDEVQKLTRQAFIVNSPDGYVIAQLEPGQSLEVAIGGDLKGYKLPRFENGQTVYMSGYMVFKGEYWGIMQTGHSYAMPGWIRMDHLLVSYTPDDFKKENQDRITKYTGSATELQNTKGVVLWGWPGSDRPKKVYEGSYEDLRIDKVYNDPEGRTWVEVYLWYGHNWGDYGWVCLDDPTNSEIPAFYPEPKPRIWTPDATYDWTVDSPILTYPVAPQDKTTTILLIVGAAVLVAAVAAGVLIRRRRAKRPSS